jgi:hypothetical protein
MGGLTDRLGVNIRAALVRAGIPTISALSQKVEWISAQNLRHRVRGDYRWTLDDVDRLAIVLRTPAELLLCGRVEEILPEPDATAYERAAAGTVDVADPAINRLVAAGLLVRSEAGVRVA